MVPEASTGYLIERKKGAETTATILTPVPVPTYLTSYADIGLIAGTQYFYRIKAKNSAGESDWSEWKDATTDRFELCLFEGIPQAPSNFTLQVPSSKQIDISWTDASTNESHFELQRSLTGRADDFHLLFPIAARNATGYTFNYSDTGLTPTTKYYYRIVASNCKGEGTTAAKDGTTLSEGGGGGGGDVVKDKLDQLILYVNGSRANQSFKDSFRCITNCPSTDDKLTETTGNQHLYELRALNAAGQRTADIGKIEWGLSSAHASLITSLTTSTPDRQQTVALSVSQAIISSGDSLRATVTNADGSVIRERVVTFDTSTETPTEPPAQNQTLTILPTGSGTGTVTSTPSGIDCGSICSFSFSKNTSVTVRARQAPQSLFSGWTGACSGLSNQCTVSLTTDKTVGALFQTNDQRTHTLRISKAGAGTGTVTSTPAGIDCGLTCQSSQSSFASGTRVKLQAVTSSNSIFTGWTVGDANFVGWTGGYTATSAQTEFMFANDLSFTANFAINDGLKHKLSVSKSGQGLGMVTGAVSTSTPAVINCGSSCETVQDSGTAITLTAQPHSSATFLGWTGGGCEAAGPISPTCTVVVATDTVVTAQFVPRSLSQIKILAVSTSTTETPIARDSFTCARASGCSDDVLPGTSGNQHAFVVRAFEKFNIVDADRVHQTLPRMGLDQSVVTAMTIDAIRSKISGPMTPQTAFAALVTVPGFPTTSTIPTESQFIQVLDTLEQVTLRRATWSLVGTTGSLAIDENDQSTAYVTAGNIKNATDSTLAVDVEGFDGFRGSASVFVTNDQCDYPWEYASASYDVRLHYCRGNGSEPLLPAFKLPPISRTPTDSAFQSEYIFQIQDPSTTTPKVDPNNTDVFVLRAALNQNWSSTADWYRASAQNVRGGVSGFEAQGFEALRDSYGAYVRVPSRPSTSTPPVYGSTWYPNILNFTTNTTASKETRDLVERILSTAEFSVSAPYNKSDYESAGMKLRRDVVRLSHLKQLVDVFEAALSKPKLLSGSYIKGQSMSAWRSWQGTLGNTLKTALPSDPYYTSSQSQFGCSDSTKCPDACKEARYDRFTCWDDNANSGAGQFAFTNVNVAATLPNVHAYTYASIAEGYQMCVKFEGPSAQQFSGISFTNDSGRVCKGCGIFGEEPCADQAGARTSCAPTLSIVTGGKCGCASRELYITGSCRHCGKRGESICSDTPATQCDAGSWNKDAQGTCVACGEYGEPLCPGAGASAGAATGTGSTPSTTGCSGNLTLVGVAPNQSCTCTGRTVYNSTAKTCVDCGKKDSPICPSSISPAKECDDWNYNKNNGGTCKACGKAVGQDICPAGAGSGDEQCSFSDELTKSTNSCEICPDYTNFAAGACPSCGYNGENACRTPHSTQACRNNLVVASGKCGCPTGQMYDPGDRKCYTCGTLDALACTFAGDTACQAWLYNDNGRCHRCGMQNDDPLCPVPDTPKQCDDWLAVNGTKCSDCGGTDQPACPPPATACRATDQLVAQGSPSLCKTCPPWSFYASAACPLCGHRDEVVCPSPASSKCYSGFVIVSSGGVEYCKDPDTTPDDFSFASVSNAQITEWKPSNEITVSGVNTPVDITLSGDASEKRYTINGAAPTASQKVSNGDKVIVSVRSSGLHSTEVKGTLGIGTFSRDFTVATRGCISGLEVMDAQQCVPCGDDNHRVCPAPANQCQANHGTYNLNDTSGLFCVQCPQYQKPGASGEGCIFDFDTAANMLNTCTECKTQGWMDFGLSADQITNRGTNSAARQEHRYWHWRALTSQWVPKATLAAAQGDIGPDGQIGTTDDDVDGDGVITQDECIGQSGPASNFGCPIPTASIHFTAPEFIDQCQSTGSSAAITETGCSNHRISPSTATVKVWWELQNAQGTVNVYHKWGAPGAESEINIGTNQPLTLTEANALTFTIDKDKVNQRIQINARAVGTDMTWLPIGDIAAALPQITSTNTGTFTSSVHVVTSDNPSSMSVDGISGEEPYDAVVTGFQKTVNQSSPTWYIARIRHSNGNILKTAVFRPVADTYSFRSIKSNEAFGTVTPDTCPGSVYNRGTADADSANDCNIGGEYQCGNTETNSGCTDTFELGCSNHQHDCKGGGICSWKYRTVTCANNTISAPSGYRY